MSTTLKLKSKRPDPVGVKPTLQRTPVRGTGAGVKKRPTLAEAQAYRAERAARQQRAEEAERTQHPSPAVRTRPPERSRSPEGSRRAEAPRGGERMQRSDRDDRDRPDNRSERAARPRPSSGPADPRFAREAVRREAPPYAPRSSERPRQPNTAFGPRTDARREPARHDSPARHTDRPDPRRDPSAPRHEPPANAYVAAPHAAGTLRLSKRMSELGLASRREADEWIAKGWVRVDGQVVNELGSRVLPEQRITVDAKARHQQAQRVTVLINKPVGYVSGQAEDGYEPAFVLVTPETLWAEDHSGTRFMREHLKSLVPAGRLDIDSVGLLVLTQDGRVARQLIGEDSEVDKEYLVRVAMKDGAALPESGLALLRHGLELDGEALKEAQVEWVNADQLRFVLHQGKKRQIRRMCEAVGLQVLGLKRVRIGKVMLGDLPTGQWRYLRGDESFV